MTISIAVTNADRLAVVVRAMIDAGCPGPVPFHLIHSIAKHIDSDVVAPWQNKHGTARKWLFADGSAVVYSDSASGPVA